MSDEQATSGATHATSGAIEQPNVTQPEAKGDIGKVASTEADESPFVKKLKTEKSNWKSKATELETKLAEYEAREKEQHEASLKEQNKWQEYAKLKEQERDELAQQLSGVETRINNATKFNAVIDALPGNVPKQYWPLIDGHLESVVLNPETGSPDESSVQHVATKIRETYSEIIDFGQKANLPQNAASPAGGFDLSQWESMSAKEKKENLPAFAAAHGLKTK